MIEIAGCYFDYNGHHYGWLWFYAGVWGFGVGAIPVLFTDPIPARTWQFSPLVLSDWNRNPKQWVHLKPCDIKTNLPSQIFRNHFPVWGQEISNSLHCSLGLMLIHWNCFLRHEGEGKLNKVVFKFLIAIQWSPLCNPVHSIHCI